MAIKTLKTDKPKLGDTIRNMFSSLIPLKKKTEEMDNGLTRSQVGEVVSFKRRTDQNRFDSGLRKKPRFRAYANRVGHVLSAEFDDNSDKTNARETLSYIIARKEFEDLERRAVSDPVIFSGINIYVSTTLAIIKPHMLVTTPEVREAITKRLLYTDRFQDMLGMSIKHLIVGGRTFVFPAYDGKKVAAFDTGDPRIIDFWRDGGTGTVLTTDGIHPKGFEYITGTMFNDKEPTKTQFLFDKDVYYLTINNFHHTDFGFGLVEILIDQIDQRISLSDSRNSRTRREGIGVPVLTYGNDRHPPTPKLQAETLHVLDEILDENTVGLIKPYTITVESLEELLKYANFKESLNTEAYLNQLTGSALGIPLSVLMMSSAGKTGAEDIMTQFFEWHVKALVKRLRLDAMLTRWAKDNVDPNAEVIVWCGDLLPGSIKETSMRLFRMGKIGKLPNNEEVRSWMSNVLGVPPDVAEAIAKGISDTTTFDPNRPEPQEPTEPKQPEEPEEKQPGSV